ncbi:MAG: hypothetical protein D6746_14850 [Bacteroidetes bacterium]|nr:MAG: hypothetical protein D6746_14850 [Bacteroidota bacterium]
MLTSILLWFIFTMREVHTVYLEFPTEIRNLPPDEALIELPPRTVRLQIKGEGIQLLRLYYNTPKIPVDAGSREVNFEAVVSEMARGVEVESVFPRTFVVRKEPRVSRTVPVRSRVEIHPLPSFELVAPLEVIPDSVAVSGAASILDRLQFWPTVHRVYRDVRDTLRVRVPLADTLTGLVLREFDAVDVVAVVEEFTEAEREIRVLVPGAPQGEEFVQLAPPVITVRYRVPLSQYDAAQRSEEFFATVPYDEIRADTTGRVRPRLHIPPDLVLRDVDYEPKTLRYFNVLLDQ